MHWHPGRAMPPASLEAFFLVYVTGDLHGDLERLKAPAIKRLGRHDTLVVLGDFGFLWTGDKKEQKALRWLGRRRYTLLFIEGTHDNYDLLAQYPRQPYMGGQARALGGQLYQLLRGEIYEIEGKKLFCFGGGESPDRLERTEGVNWWAAEMPTDQEMENAEAALAAAGWQVDYMLTHEGPDHLLRFVQQHRVETNGLARFFSRLAEKTQYKKWFFGCHHTDLNIGSKAAMVYKEVLPLE